MTTTTVLKKAKALIQKYGWIQKSNGDQKHGFCASGAISNVINGCDCEKNGCNGNKPCIYVRTENALSRAMKYKPITIYNDAPGRTKEQVLGRFDRAIKLCKNS
jgi:hypothetical protein